jgi:hypothetical protein
VIVVVVGFEVGSVMVVLRGWKLDSYEKKRYPLLFFWRQIENLSKLSSFELKETQNNQGHSLNLLYISAISLRVAVGARWTAAFFFLPSFSFIENEAALRGK